MHIGVAMFATDYAIPIDELARETEARGFESLWVPEHTHIPTSRRSPWAGGGAAEGVPPYVRSLHLIDAGRTAAKNLKLGTGICLIIERDTIITAKEVASLDRLSGGRFSLASVAAGTLKRWSITARCSRRFQEDGRAGARHEEIWTKDVAEFHGEHVNFEPIWCWPKPAQQPHPSRAARWRELLHAAAHRRLLRRLVPTQPQP